jgi:hypothetical protein
MPQIVAKKVKLNLTQVDGNAFSLMSAFTEKARRDRWTAGEIEAILDAATDGDYNHLVATLSAHCE